MRRVGSVVPLVAVLMLSLTASASPAPTATKVRLIRTSNWHRPSPDPTGIAYQRSTGRFFVVDSEVDETPSYAGANVWFKPPVRRTPTRHWSTFGFSVEPTDVAVRGPRTLFFTDDRCHKIFIVHPGPDRHWGTADDIVTSFRAGAFGDRDVEGLTFARVGDRTVMFTLSGKRSMVFGLTPGPDHRFDGVPPAGDDVVRTSFSTSAMGLTDPKGIAFDPASRLLYIVGHDQPMILRTNLRGKLLDTIDLSASGLRHASGITLAPGSTDPTARHIYITDWGARHTNDGRIFEFALS